MRDWEHGDARYERPFRLSCPTCRYDLTSLMALEMFCPECGQRCTIEEAAPRRVRFRNARPGEVLLTIGPAIANALLLAVALLVDPIGLLTLLLALAMIYLTPLIELVAFAAILVVSRFGGRSCARPRWESLLAWAFFTNVGVYAVAWFLVSMAFSAVAAV